MNQPEHDPTANVLGWLEAAPFAELLAAVDRIGTNKGDRRVIDMYRAWLAFQGNGGRHGHAAWFNLGAEWSHARDQDNFRRDPRLSHCWRCGPTSCPPRPPWARCSNAAATPPPG